MSVGRKKLSVCQNYVAAFSCCEKYIKSHFHFVRSSDFGCERIFSDVRDVRRKAGNSGCPTRNPNEMEISLKK